LNCISGAKSCLFGSRRFIVKTFRPGPLRLESLRGQCGGHRATQIVEITARQAELAISQESGG
jgi:hypothetical protein